MNKSILAVDDQSAIIGIIKQSLQIQEFKVCAFTDPFAALAHFNSDSKDYHHIVLSDIRMPGMSAYEFVRKVKESNPKVKVILRALLRLKTRSSQCIARYQGGCLPSKSIFHRTVK
jgi:DNA-binding NtrC family response regulator